MDVADDAGLGGSVREDVLVEVALEEVTDGAISWILGREEEALPH